MKRALAILLCLGLAGCTPAVSANRYGLRVVPDRAAYERLVRSDPDQRLVDVASLGIATDVRYASADNFMKRPLYPMAKVVLRAPVAHALAAADRELAARGLRLKVFDGYRPYRVTVAMWEAIGDPDFVADPAKGSRHNRGAAVDLTIVDGATGRELRMPTAYDDFTPRAAHAWDELTDEERSNRELLRALMVRHGFDPLPSEWWHYDFRGWERFDPMDVPLEALNGSSR